MLSETDNQKLAKFLGMMGSHHDGEVITAARKAHDLVHKQNHTWPEIIGVSETEVQRPAHHNILLNLLKHEHSLTRFELSFLRGITAFHVLSDKQQQTLATIEAKISALED